MWRNLFIAAVVVGLALTGSWMMERADLSDAPPPEATDAALNPNAAALVPDFEFATLDGQSMSIRTLAGKTVLLNFWASWCAPCQTEFPMLLALAAREKDNLVLVAVSVDHDSDARDKFLARMSEDYADLYPAANVLLVDDAPKAIAQDLFQTIRYPETILIAPDQTMVEKIAGEIDWTGSEMAQKLASLKTKPQGVK